MHFFFFFFSFFLFLRYTPSQQGVAFNSGAKQRVIRMVEMQKDPMEPPRFKYVSMSASPSFEPCIRTDLQLIQYLYNKLSKNNLMAVFLGEEYFYHIHNLFFWIKHQ